MATKATNTPRPRRVREELPVQTYLVGPVAIHHDGEAYEPSDDIELTEPQAARLGDLVSLKPAD